MKRQSNFELLRIVAMLFIICCHMMGHTIIPQIQSDTSSNAYIAAGFWIWGGLGVNLFSFISAWFLVDSDFRIQRPLSVAVKTWIYSVTLMLVGIVFTLGDYSLEAYGRGVLPVICGEYWYTTAWIGMVLLSPFLNIAIKSMGKNKWNCMIVVSTILLSIIPDVIPQLPWYSDLIWLIYCYILVGGIRYYEVKIPKRRDCLLTFIISFVLILISTEITLYFARSYPILYKGMGYFSNRCVFIMLICSLSLFTVFKQLNIKHRKIINILGGATFGVYLIHENAFVNEYIWNSLLPVKKFYTENPIGFAGWCIVLLAVCFIVCAMIDIGISIIIKKFILERKWCIRICDRINKWYAK